MKHMNYNFYIICFIICSIIIFALTACSSNNTKQTQYKEELINQNISTQFTILEKSNIDNSCYSYILVDNDTKVMYSLFISNSYYNTGSSSILPLYNADGTLRIYEN